MVEQTTRYGIATTVDMPYERALVRTRAELAREGFGVLTEIDVAATLKKKLDVEFRPYMILGACNVIVYQDDVPTRSVVAAMDPEEALALTGNESLRAVGTEVKGRLQRVLERLA
jgi:uncharacterized protein (DUF302 family)